MDVFPTRVGTAPGLLTILLEHPQGGSPGSVPLGTTHWSEQGLITGTTHWSGQGPVTETTYWSGQGPITGTTHWSEQGPVPRTTYWSGQGPVTGTEAQTCILTVGFCLLASIAQGHRASSFLPKSSYGSPGASTVNAIRQLVG